jgi:sodium/potassium-transporting ATPase subunit alpha
MPPATTPSARIYTPQGDEHRLPLDELLTRLQASPAGLSGAEAARRLASHGPNRLAVKPSVSEWTRFWRQFANLFAGLLLFGAGLAGVSEYLDPGQDNLTIALALVGVVFLNSLFTYLQERQSERILESFHKMLPQAIPVLRDGVERRVAAADLVPGDVIPLNEGDRIPADCRLLACNALKIDLSALTGESEPQLRALRCTHEVLLESRNMAFSGALVQSGVGLAVVHATGMDTEIGRIVALTKGVAEVKTPLRLELERFVRVVSLISIAMGLTFFGIGLALGQDHIASLLFGIGIIVANVPEGLLPTVTLALALASQRLARRNALIKNLEAVETLGSTSVIVTDKTGTITQNRMSVHTLVLARREWPAFDPRLPEQAELALAWECMALCNNARPGVGPGPRGGPEALVMLGDPMDVALHNYAQRLRPVAELADRQRLEEHPFDSATRRMIAVHTRPDGGRRAYLKGAPEVVLALCAAVAEEGRQPALTARRRERALATCDHLGRRGERVLALAYRDLGPDEPAVGSPDPMDPGTGRPAASAAAPAPPAADDGFVYLGLVGMLDPPRSAVRDAVARCRTAGIRVIMVTGDHGVTAEAIARQVGLLRDGGRVVLGAELAGLDATGLDALLAAPHDLVFARSSPLQKLQIVQALQRRGEVVTVTGDGVNDAPALKNADMGVAMGVMGTEVAKEAARMVLLDDNFATIVAAVEEGRAIYANLERFIGYILSHTVPEVLPYVAFLFLHVPLPLTVVLILCIDLGTDILPALGLGVEPPEAETMHRPPRPRGESLLTAGLLWRSYALGGLLIAGACFAAYFCVLAVGGWHWGQTLAPGAPLHRAAVTVYFATLVACQIANALRRHGAAARHRRIRFLGNRLLALGVVVAVLLVVLLTEVPLGNAIFGTVPLAFWQWGLVTALGAVVYALGRRPFARVPPPA